MVAQDGVPTIFDAYLGPLSPETEDGRRVLLRESDNLLGRFGEAARLAILPGRAVPFTVRETADRVWILLEGAVWAVMHDLRDSSPSHGTTHAVRLDGRPHALLLIPFGVACAPRAIGGPAHLLEMASRDRVRGDAGREFAAEDASIAFDWSSLNG
jgi:hypothetical protein